MERKKFQGFMLCGELVSISDRLSEMVISQNIYRTISESQMEKLEKICSTLKEEVDDFIDSFE